ncbi:hypothetical protein PM082_021965 [Marasmius tenuissimus]|nr:hypothetical protein PM082_021965 [Marasmius tenuissimus]
MQPSYTKVQTYDRGASDLSAAKDKKQLPRVLDCAFLAAVRGRPLADFCYNPTLTRIQPAAPYYAQHTSESHHLQLAVCRRRSPVQLHHTRALRVYRLVHLFLTAQVSHRQPLETAVTPAIGRERGRVGVCALTALNSGQYSHHPSSLVKRRADSQMDGSCFPTHNPD